MTSPLTIEIIIHYYVSSSEADDYRDSPAFRSVAKDLVLRGILEKSSESGHRKYNPNRSACGVYLEALGNVPLPTKEWTIKQS
jgi:hypothetical protein